MSRTGVEPTGSEFVLQLDGSTLIPCKEDRPSCQKCISTIVHDTITSHMLMVNSSIVFQNLFKPSSRLHSDIVNSICNIFLHKANIKRGMS